MTNHLEQLAAWLQRPIYEQGVLLYEQLFGQGFLLTMFKQGNDEYNYDTLSAALSTHYDKLQAEEKAREDAYPEPLVEELAAAGRLMDERTLLKERMRGYVNQGITEGPELKEMAFRILAIKDELDLIYGRKHFFNKNGFLPDQASASLPEAESPADQLKRRNSLRTYVSKYQRQYDEATTDKRKAELLKKLTGFKQELHDVQNRLDLLNPKQC